MTKHRAVEKNKDIRLKHALITLGLLGVGIGMSYRQDKRYHYFGEQLIKKQITLANTPQYINPRRGITRYLLHSKEFRCSFWIAGGSLDIIRENKNIETQIESIVKGDTIDIMIKEIDTSILNNGDAISRIIQLEIRNKTLLEAKQVIKEDKNIFYLNLYFSLTFIIVGCILHIYDIVQKRRKGIVKM